MRHCIYSIIILLIFSTCNSDVKDELIFIGRDKVEVIQISNTRYQVNTSKTEIEPGLNYYLLTVISETNPVIAHVLEMNPEVSALKVEAFTAGSLLSDIASPLVIAQNNTTAQKEVVALINGDFFNSSGDKRPLGGVMVNGKMIKSPQYDWTMLLGFDENNNPYDGALLFDASLTFANGTVAKFSTMNNGRQANYLVLYDTHFGGATETNEWGVEYLLKPVEGDWEQLASYQNVRCKVIGVRAEGNTTKSTIEAGCIVISGHGTQQGLLVNNIKLNDEVVIHLNGFKEDENTPLVLKSVLGAQSKVLNNSVVNRNNNDGQLAQRSLIGYSRYTGNIYMVAIEGRSMESSGTKIDGGGDIIKFMGATDAVNLDGGGSTCLVINNKIVNKLIDNAVRPVPNAWGLARYK